MPSTQHTPEPEPSRAEAPVEMLEKRYEEERQRVMDDAMDQRLRLIKEISA